MSVTPFLMFQGDAEAALNLYVATIPGSDIQSITRYGPDEEGVEGSVKIAHASLGGLKVIINDSPIKHDFTFSPSLSLFVVLADEAEIERVVKTLAADGGSMLMPLGDYGFSRKFAWVSDRYGVSWQISFE